MIKRHENCNDNIMMINQGFTNSAVAQSHIVKGENNPEKKTFHFINGCFQNTKKVNIV